MSYPRMNLDPQFKPVDHIYESRLQQFTDAGGDYRDLNLPHFYDKKRIPLDQDLVKVEWYQVPFDKNTSPVSPEKRPSYKQVIDADRKGQLKFRPAGKGQPFGPSWSTTWFKIHLKIPQDWLDSNERLIFEWDCGNEGVVVDPERLVPVTAFSGGERKEYMLPKGRKHLFFYIECGNNGMFGCGNGSSINPPDDNRYFHLSAADLVWPNWQARGLYIDFWMLGDAARELPGNSWQKHRARHVGNIIMDLFDPGDPKSVEKCRELCHAEMFDKFVESPEVYQQGDSQVMNNVFAMGNCHIDTAWLWPFAETRRKVARSWSSQCTLMDEYPEYQFVASQAQQFKWLLEDHPEFFHNVLVPKVQQSQFFPIGGSWVENDTNVPSGESLCRQFFFGQRFFLKYFGKKSEIFWLPDTFGYSSQIPQLAQTSGINKFLTQKLSWNNINSFPHTTFNWSGIDGSQLLTHMPPGNTYTADSHFGDVLRTATQNKTSEFYGSGLMLYGKGDGGGGPTREMLEKMRRIRSLNNRNGNIIPKLHVGSTVEEFFEDILNKTNTGKTLPTWCGELYFEFHRGTYTTQAMVKKLMRLSEVKLHDLEWLATKASVLFPKDYNYPANEINALWEDVLLCQFHDVLPGSCIEMVYKEEALPKLEHAIKKCEELIKQVLTVLPSDKDYIEVGTLQWPTERPSSDNDSLLYPASVVVLDDAIVMTNKKLQVSISKLSGVITSVVDLNSDVEYLDLKNGRNNLGGNQFVLFDDKPLGWQAWDTELYSVNQYKYITEIESVKISDNSKEKCSVEVIFKISEDCKITTKISLTFTTPATLDESKIDIETQVDNWNLRNKFLKVEFPVNVHNDFASYETQFGITKRPTHYNTSWDVAKFEVCHHKFADYSDFSKGVSIMNNCKYGFATHGNLMRLSLLRSSKAPDAHADMGSHEIKYALYPHKGALSAETVKLALQLNFGYKYGVASNIAKQFNEVIEILGDGNIIFSNMKRGEDDSEIASDYSLKPRDERSIILRVYESLGGESRAKLLTTLPIKKVEKIDSLELEKVETLSFKKTNESVYGKYEIPIKLRPFEVATYKLLL